MKCLRCADTGWLCEEHPRQADGRRWLRWRWHAVPRVAIHQTAIIRPDVSRIMRIDYDKDGESRL
jgi:hypothetical protein